MSLAKVGELESAAEYCVKLQWRAAPPRPPGKTKVKVGHKCLGSAVESIGDHLAVRGTRDLDASVLQGSKPGAGGEQCHEGSTECARSPE